MSGDASMQNLIDQVFKIRTDLFKIGRIVSSMKELLYRVLGSSHLEYFRTNIRHFNDIYDHLLMLSDMIESNREITADARDNFCPLIHTE